MKATKHIGRDFYSVAWPWSCSEGGTWGCLGAKIKLCSAVCLLCYLLLNHWTNFNQIWFVSNSHKWGVQRDFFLPRLLGPWGGVKRSNMIKFQLQSQFQRFFIPNFVCVLTNERYKTYQTKFSLFCLGHAPGMGFWGAGDAQVVSFFSNMIMWHSKSTRMTSRSECK